MQDNGAVNKAFSAQSAHYDEDDKANMVIADLRQQVYRHVARFMKEKSRVLELNAGTGIDAAWFASKGHSVLATDLSDGMVSEMKKKGIDARQLSYDKINSIGEKFDYVFSNFGGLNCIDDLGKVTTHLSGLLKPGGSVTWVIMPPVCLWEIMSMTFRRFHKNGVMAHIDGHYFRTWYHSLSDIKKAFGDQFEFIESEGLAALSPPPHKTDFFAYRFSRKIDQVFNRTFPFNRWADHIIVTFRKAS
ncbi:MAG: methyltransferase domain-containing protein [Bacteroidota bacterium]